MVLLSGSGPFTRGLSTDADTLQIGVFVNPFNPITEDNDLYSIQHKSKKAKVDLTIGEVAGSTIVQLKTGAVSYFQKFFILNIYLYFTGCPRKISISNNG